MKCIITIEIGTNAVRVFAFDLAGNTIGSMKGHYPTFHTEPDRSEQDPDQIFITVLNVLRNLLDEVVHARNHQVSIICFSSTMHSVLAVDRNGIPLGNVLTWADSRAKREADELKQSALGATLYNNTGTPLHPMSPLVKIAWMKNNEPEKFSQVSKFLSIKSYIIEQLTGEYLIDYSLASATGLLNNRTIQWESDALDYAGISAGQLPELVPVFASAGRLRKAYQNLMGLSPDTRLLVGSSDGCMATFGAGIWDERKATITIEDSGAVRVVGKEMIQDPKKRFFNYLLTEDCYVSGGPTNNGGVIFEWFTQQFGNFRAPYYSEHIMDEMIAEASRIPAGSEGLLFLPYLLGERAPIWNANARGVFFGLNIKHERQHFIRAVIEGILYEIFSIGKILEEHRPIDSLSVNGSFATIPFCTQIIADMFNKPVSLRKNMQSVSMGSFLLSAIDMGIYKSLDEAAQTVSLPITYVPDDRHHRVYREYYEIFEKLSYGYSDAFESIVRMQHQLVAENTVSRVIEDIK